MVWLREILQADMEPLYEWANDLTVRTKTQRKIKTYCEDET